jgi:hypothetical protein
LERDFQPGDVDGDDRLTITDALLALRHALGLQPLGPAQLRAADINADGEVNVRDAVLILKKEMGL